MMTSSYMHATRGRLRVKIPEIKNAPARVLKIEAVMRRQQGITYAQTNLLTGNLLILFDSAATDHGRILKILKDLGCLKARRNAAQPGKVIPSQIEAIFVRLLLEATFEIALKRFVPMLI